MCIRDRPDSIRSIVRGPSACGKTNVMLNLLFDVNGVRFANLYVFSKSLFQLKYRMLETLMTQLVDCLLYTSSPINNYNCCVRIRQWRLCFYVFCLCALVTVHIVFCFPCIVLECHQRDVYKRQYYYSEKVKLQEMTNLKTVGFRLSYLMSVIN